MRSLRIAYALVAVLLLAFPVKPAATEAFSNYAGEAESKDKKEVKKKQKKSRSYADKIRSRGAKPKAKPKKKPKYKKWSEVTKDAEVKEGLFKVYTKREDVYFEIKKDQLDKPMLAVLSLSKGIGAKFILGGLPIDDVMFDFHRVEDHVQVRRLNTLFRASDDPALQKAIELTFGNSILFSLKIESEDESTGSVLVKMNEVFVSDLPDLGFWMRMVLKKPVRLDKKKGFLSSIKVFPKNVEIEAMLTYLPGDRKGLYLPSVPDSRFIEVGVHYSIATLPEDPMPSRLADDRVGYFLTPFKDFKRDDKESFMVHYINKWRLEKKEPGADLSEPKNPIIFYLDHTIPDKYREYVAAGIEEWQKAFETAGFKNAIIAKEAPDDPDFDPEDARYNTIRWIVSDSPSFGAIGPSRVDPRTGEILDADILIDGNMVARFRKVYKHYAGPDAFMGSDPFMRFIDYPNKIESEEPALGFYKNHRWLCNIGEGMDDGAALMRIVMLASGEIEAGMEVPEEYVGEALKEVTMHEVGHTLGLRHNFKSSVAVPYDKLNDRDFIEKVGMTGSVMDYASPNVAPDRKSQGYYYSPTVGLYDRWAIKWGYMEVPGDTPEERNDVLQEVAREASKQDNLYGTDEDTYPAGALDPLCNIWDLGDDPMRFALDRMAVIGDLLKNGKLEERLIGEGDSYTTLRSAVQVLFVQNYIAAGMAIKYVGGQYTSRSHRGDEGGKMPFEPVPASEQRKAMRFIIEHGFSPDAFTLNPELLNKLIDSKLYDWENNLFARGRRFDFPLLSWVNAVQFSILSRLMQPYLLQRILEAEYKVDDPFTLAEFFRTLTKAIWFDHMMAGGKTAPMRRNLQRNYLRMLTWMAVKPFAGTPDEAVALARLNLVRIRSGIDKAFKNPGLSDAINAHLMESKARIDRALEAKAQAGL